MSEAPMDRDRELKWIKTEKIINNDQNPRAEEEFKPEALEALRHSIKTHGLFQPLIVTEYRKDSFKIIEGERRWTSAKLENIKELPAVVVNRMDPKDEVITMFNIHTQFKGWQVAEELRAIQEIRDRNGQLTDEQLAKELGMNLATYRDRVRVLKMGAAVVRDIATDKIQFSAALRSDEVTKMLVKKRPKLVDKIGGAKEVTDRLIAKSKARKRGISQELVQFRHDLGDTERVSDKAVEEYLREPEVGFREILYRHKDAEDAHKVDELSGKVAQLAREFRKFNPKAMSVDNLSKLRRDISELLEVGQELESKITDELRRAKGGA